MEKKIKQMLTLDRPVTYQIKVPGKLDGVWTEWYEKMAIDSDCSGLPVSTLTGSFDQASLHSLLRRLYSLGLPLISVICVDCD